MIYPGSVIERLNRLTPHAISPRIFWTFQAIFWLSVFAWRTAYTYANGYGLGWIDLRLISIMGAVMATYGIAQIVIRLAPRGMRFHHIVLIIGLTLVIALGHTALDRLLYTSARNGWQLTPFVWDEYLQILSVNAWVFLSWTAFFIVVLLFSRLRERDKAIQALTQVAKDARLQTLMHQLNPHFLFNTLNSLSALIAEKRERDADQMLLQLSRFLRHVIDADHEEKTDLQSEIAIMRDYLAIQKVRFGDRLNFDIQVSENCQSALLPILILQPIVENAIKHGQDAKTGICEVSITAKRRQGRLLLTITDQGKGFSDATFADRGAGLSLIRSRLTAHYGNDAQLVTSNAESGGASVTLSMELESALDPDIEQFA